MPITHINRKGDIYHLHQGTTKKGNPKYYFSKKEPDNPVETIPDGYEIYENPNAQIFLRRIPPKLISDDERRIVAQAIIAYTQLRHYQIDVKNKAITIYLADQDVGALNAIPGTFGRFLSSDQMEKYLSYSPLMRFILFDKESREFEAERYNFRGSIDDWIPISDPDSLDKLARKFVPHLGQESFYELY